MKVFEVPEIQLTKFELEDVITTSVLDDQTPPAVRD